MVLVVRCSLCGDILECSKSNRQVLFDHIREKHPQIALDTCRRPSQASKLEADSKCVLNELMRETDENDQGPVTGFDDGLTKPVDPQNDKKRVTLPRSPRPMRSSLPPQTTQQKPPPSSARRAASLRQPGEHNYDNKENENNACQWPPGSRPPQKNKGADVLYEREYSTKKPFVPRDVDKHKKFKNPKLYRTTVEKWRPGITKIHCPKCDETRTPIIKATQNKVSKSPTGAACILTCWPFCFLPCLFPPPTHENLYCRKCDYFLGIYDHKTGKAEPNAEAADSEPVREQ